MIIRSAVSNDSFDIFLWRNDSTSRAMFVSTDKVSWLDHNKWFNTSILNKKRLMFIGVAGHLKVGVCRFDLNEVGDEAEVSINLNPVARCKNLSQDLLSASIRRFLRDFSNVELVATIRKENTASLRCFKNCGFLFTHSNIDYLFFELTAEVI